MNTRALLVGSVLLCLLSVVLWGCPPKPPARGPAQVKKDARAERLRVAEDLLSMVPASSDGLLLLDTRGLYGGWRDAQRSLEQTDQGRRWLKQARKELTRGKVSVPFSVEELTRLGIDPDRPVLMYGENEHWVALLYIHDEAAFRKMMAFGGIGKWIKKTSRGRIFHHLGDDRCHFRQRRVVCASRDDLLHIALQHRPERSVWHVLTPVQRKELATANAAIFVKDKDFGMTGSVRVEDDGLSAALRIRGSSWAEIAPFYEEMKPRTILGLASGRTQAYARINLGAVIKQLAERSGNGLPAGAKAMGLDLDTLQKGLTGELLLVERPGNQLALILGCTDEKLSRMLTALAITGIQTVLRPRKNVPLSAVVTQAPGSAGSDALIQVTSTHDRFPLKVKARLQAGKAGIILGTDELVRALAGRALPPAVAFTSTLTTDTDRRAFGPRAALALRTGLGDPLEMAATFLPADMLTADLKQLDASTRRMLDLVRFAMDQLHGVTLGMYPDSKGGLRVVARLHTLHQAGEPGADAARALWVRGVKAKLAGDAAEYGRVQQQLAARYPKTRFGAIKRQRAAGVGTSYAALVSAMASVAVPAFTKNVRRAKTTEALVSMQAIMAGAHQYYDADLYDKNGKLLPNRFPPSVPLTPAGGPPCGKHATTPQAVWDKQGWGTMKFSPTNPHRYAYSFASSGTGATSTYTARAHGDLDCDGVLSTFEIRGSVNKAGEIKAVGPVITNELE